MSRPKKRPTVCFVILVAVLPVLGLYAPVSAAPVNFGNTTAGGAGDTIINSIRGSLFLSPGVSGQVFEVQSITAYLKNKSIDTSRNVKCAIYDGSPGWPPPNDATTRDYSLVGYTEERSLSDMANPAWVTFNFADPKPTISGAAYYVLVCWAASISIGESIDLYYVPTTDGSQRDLHTSLTYASWPNPASLKLKGWKTPCIYATVEPAQPTGGCSSPTYAAANVDGDYSEWDLTEDFFANMYEAWNENGNKPVTANLYLRYDCASHVVYVLVMSVDPSSKPVYVAGDEYVAVDDINNKVDFSGFAWVNQHDGYADGWEASFPDSRTGSKAYNLRDGFDHDIFAHTDLYYSEKSQTSGTDRDNPPCLRISCPPTIVTTLSATQVTVGTPVTDSATLSGVTSDAGGTIVFKVFSGSDTTCSGTVLFTSNAITVNGPNTYGPSTPSFTPTSVGTFRWQAFYSGDANNNPATSACSAEILTVNQASPSIVTVVSPSTITLGGSASDTATLSGGFNPTGSINFTAYGPSDTASCSGTAVFTSVVTVNGNGPYTSGSFTPAAAGTYWWIASYSGDGNNNAVSTSCGDSGETLVVNKVRPSIVTLLSATQVPLGTPVNDTATLSGATSDATGTITFKVFTTSDCSGGPEFTSNTIDVNGNGQYGPSQPNFIPTSVGTYRWQAFYSGDGKNDPATSACELEILTVKAAPSIVTTLSATKVPLGTPVNDTATLSDATSDAVGTITFKVFTTSDCSGSAAFTSNTISVNGNGQYGPSQPNFIPSSVGLYYWQAFYSGDGKNNPAESSCSAEVLEVGGSLGTISTSLSALEVPVGSPVNDTATLSGVTSDAEGTIVFKVFSGSDTTCSGTVLFTSNAISVSGPDTYGPSQPNFTPTSVGTYRWQAFYSGDDNNNPAKSACDAEILTVETGPSIRTVLSASVITLGESVWDSVILTGVTADPDDTVTYNVYDDPYCSVGHIVFTSTKTVVTSGVLPDSDPFTPTLAGHYEWQAVYTGLQNHITLTDECGNEPLEVRSGDGQPPVGGELYEPNKLVLLKPYLTLLGLLAAVATAVAITRGRRP